MDSVIREMLYERICEIIDNDFNTSFDHPYSVWHDSGATKGTYIFDDCAWVVKVSLEERYNHYIKEECDNYALAVEEGLADFFAKTEFLGEYDGVFIEAQLKLNCNEDSTWSKVYDSLDIDYVRDCYSDEYDACTDYSFEEYLNSYVDEISECLDDTLNYIFSGDVSDLIDFCEKHRINDLHYGNFGQDDNGNWRIIDFSGYRG